MLFADAESESLDTYERDHRGQHGPAFAGDTTPPPVSSPSNRLSQAFHHVLISRFE